MKRVALCLFSVGWLLPAWFGTYLMMVFIQEQVVPLLRGQETSARFPFIYSIIECYAVAFAWLALVVLFWSWQLAPIILKKKEPIQLPETTRGK